MLFLLLSCATGPTPRPDHDHDTAAPFALSGAAPSLEVTFAAGDTAFLVFGGQGGFHVDVGGVVRGLGALVALELWVDVDGVRIAQQGEAPTYLRLAADPAADLAWFDAERAFILDNSLVTVCGWQGREATVCARARSLVDAALVVGDCEAVVLAMEPANAYMCG